MYTALELARAAGYVIVRRDHGGVTPTDLGDGRMVLELGPDADDAAILAVSLPYLELPPLTSIAEITL